MKKSRSQFGIAIIGVLGGAVFTYLGLLGLSYYEDPFHLFHVGNPPPDNEKRLSIQRILGGYSYVTKAKSIIDQKPDRILLGSSVENFGMRVEGSYLNNIDPSPDKFAQWRSIFPPNTQLYDAAIGGGGLEEAYDFLQHAYLNNPNLKEVVLGVEWREFAVRLPNQESKNMPTVSALHRRSTPVGFLLQYTASKLALDFAFQLFEARSPENNTFGRILGNLLMPGDYIFPKLDKIIANHLTFKEGGSDDLHPVVTAEPLFADANEALNVAASLWMANWFHTNYVEHGKDALLRPAMLEKLKSIVRFCRERKIKLRMFLSPEPAFFWEIVRKYGLENEVARWFREVVQISPVYDFSAQISFNENHFAYFSDPLHFKENAGELIIEGLYKEHPSFLPRIITQENVEAFIAWRKKALDSWESDEPRLSRVANLLPLHDTKATNVVTASKTTNVNVWLVPYEPEYHGYKVYTLFDTFIAIPATIKPPFQLLTILEASYPGLIKAGSLKAIQAAIDHGK